MRIFGLIGHPLTHSFSKKYFTEKFAKEGLIDCKYELFPIASISELTNILASTPSLCGLNVTIPYKESVLPFLGEMGPVVKQIGACNCIRIAGGKLSGFNTDVIGFEQALKKKLGPYHKKALVLGTGGSAKAVEFVLNKLGISFHYVSRKPSVNNYSYEQLTPAIVSEHSLIINTTPLGMYPAINEAAPIPYQGLTAKHYLFDLIYNPAQTLFLQKGEEHGATTSNGLEMLVVQAEESWKIWNE